MLKEDHSIDDIYKTSHKKIEDKAPLAAKQLRKTFMQRTKEWRRWPYVHGIDKEGNLLDGLSDESKLSPKEKQIKRLKTHIRENTDANREYSLQQYFPWYTGEDKLLTEEEVEKIFKQEITKETPLVEPIAYRFHPDTGKITYFICELPNGELGDFYHQEFKLASITSREDLKRIMEQNQMKHIGDKARVKITALFQLSEKLQKEIKSEINS